MKSLLFSLLFTVALIPIIAPSQSNSPQSPVEIRGEPRHHPKFENEFVRIWDVTVPAGDATLWHVHRNDNVVVTLGGATLRIENMSSATVEGEWKFGDVRFSKATYVHRAINIGTAPFHNLTIELLKSPFSGSEAVTARTGPEIYSQKQRGPRLSDRLQEMEKRTDSKPVIDNDRVRVYRLSLAPGESTKVHTHFLPGLGLVITAAEVEVVTKGKDKPDRLKLPAGDLRWRASPVTHSIKNIGGTRFEAVDIELK